MTLCKPGDPKVLVGEVFCERVKLGPLSLPLSTLLINSRCSGRGFKCPQKDIDEGGVDNGQNLAILLAHSSCHADSWSTFGSAPRGVVGTG